ncbi:MAG TPA: alpha-(1-_3)-arabinofuranosyltransferase family protein, partial [Ilumatobacteraceae bacterium]|nr:alpha-(1->3)-arabinofuranosyltransferase family protein [Ilumatobacteraceae bacterium]
MNRPASNRSWPARFAAGAIAALAYLAPLLSGAHTLNADTKLGLTLNPGRLLSDARLTWDGHQFAGWVPHQTVSYLWPSGPFYWVADRVGLPDWVTQRLWISTLLCAAGLGVLWLLRRLGLGVSAALAGAAVYMLSPYVLAYLSRTSVMLLPWAGLPWIVGFTARAGQQRSWRWPAAVALVVATVGAVNATALAMIIPGPVLWLVCAAWSGQITWRSAARAAA